MGKVGCVGIVVADTFCGPLQALPREGQLLAIDAMPQKVGGCAANVAIDLVRQGLEVDVIGCLGNDPEAASLRSGLAEQGVGCDQLVQTSEYPTSKTVILLIEGRDRRYIHVFGANQAFTVSHISREWLTGIDVFYLGGLLAMPGIDTDELLDILQFCRDRGIATVVDVVVPHGFSDTKDIAKLLPHIDYFLPNDDESQLITGHSAVLDKLRAFQRMGANTVIITKGRDGAFAAQENIYWQFGAYSCSAVDPSGAGDAFASGVIAALMHGWDMPTMLRYASAIGTSATRAVGTTDSVFTSEQAERFMQSNPMQIVQGVLDEAFVEANQDEI